ncbi:MAG: CRISPR-associated protein Cas4 [Tissierellia bacterium]|nr:CRISPR-associated protein Cas4 [Tissierellia bacterium]
MEYIQISAIQHFVYCKRQWALAYLEQQWEENEDTIMGQYVHRNVDDEYYIEKRRDSIFVRSLPIISHELKISGIADMVEYRKNSDGVEIKNYKGKWLPYVIEYKKGKPKKDNCDILQLVAQVMSIEEMNNCKINESAIYYKTANKRFVVNITKDLRDELKETLLQMREIYKTKQTPKAQKGKYCQRCSLKEQCMPRLTTHKRSVVNYINKYLME